MASQVVQRDGDPKVIDKGIKNVWKWEWLERSVDGELIGRFMRKLNKPGTAYCELCHKEVTYRSRGWRSLDQHVRMKVHKDNFKLRTSNYSLSSAFGQKQKETEAPYGIHPMFRAAAKTLTPTVPAETATPLADRVVNAEAMVLGFTAEHSLSFAVTPDLIALAKALAKDRKVLQSLAMSRTTASYKTRFGLGKTFEDQMLERMKSVFFSLNMDESTSCNFEKVLTILVSYFCPEAKQIVVHHFASLTCVKTDSESLYNEVVELFQKKEVPWTNLMSILMDSCNVMRGSKSGLETRIRQEKAPHLLDVDGDVCHHVHNAAKAFCKPFNWFVEQLLNDVFNDFKWSPDIRDWFKEVCEMLGVKFTMPQRFVSHRWLSVYDVTVDTLRLFDPLTVFYFGLLTEHERHQFTSTIVEIYHRLGVSELSRDRIIEIRKALSKKNVTKDGKDRKDRIVFHLFTQRKKTVMIMGIYSSVFPLLKNFVLLFEMKEPLIHELHEKQTKLFKEFLGCFIKAEVINTATSGLKLKRLDLAKGKLNAARMFLGARALKLVNSSSTPSHLKTEFLKQVEEAYSACGAKLQERLPLCNLFLKAVSFLHPAAAGHSLTLKYLQKLPTLATNVLNDEDEEMFELEIRKYQTNTLPEFPEGMRIDIWWANEEICSMYPALSKMAKALLCCFHGPQVESSFNLMNDIIDCKSGRINIETYTAIQNIKYGLKSSNKSAIQYFTKEDPLHEKINSALVTNMRTSRKQYHAILDEKKMEKEEKQKTLDIQSRSLLSKRKAKELIAKAAKKARIAHQNKP